MIPCSDMIALFDDWLGKVEEAVRIEDGNALCESTRMALAFAMILRTYFPETMTVEVRDRMRILFSQASRTIDDLVDRGVNPDNCYDLYQENVRDRQNKFEELAKTWWGAVTPT